MTYILYKSTVPANINFAAFSTLFKKSAFWGRQICLFCSLWQHLRPCKDKGDSSGALLTDLSKAFDCLLHELLTGKIAAYDFSRSALNLMYTYLFDRIQRTKISIFYSSWQDILSSIPQGSILGPLLFNIFLCDLFLMINNIDFASYADDNAPYTTDESAEKIID